MWPEICSEISKIIGRKFEFLQADSLGGGCINEAYRLNGKSESFFVKLNSASKLTMFEAELAGLEEMRSAKAIRIPEPLCCGTVDSKAYIVMEYIPMGGSGDAARMGKDLARMHRKTNDKFGWSRNNTIGSTPQINDLSSNWIEFYRDKRLKYQFDLARRRGMEFRGEEDLLNRIPEFFEAYTPEPSLLHGDLWGGNASYDKEGTPVIYDPAVYYGDREAEIAFTELFGGFGRAFYKAYNDEWPLDSAYSQRKTLYNLYHILNHYNLFGGGYASQAQSMISELL